MQEQGISVTLNKPANHRGYLEFSSNLDMYSLNFCKFIGMRISLFNSSQGHCLHSSQYFIPLFAAQAFLFSNHFSLALRNFETPYSLTCFILHQTSKNHALDSNVSALKKSKNLHGKLSQSKHKSRFLLVAHL